MQAGGGEAISHPEELRNRLAVESSEGEAMNIFTQMKLLVKIKPDINEIAQGIQMKSVTQTVAGITAAATAVYQIPQVKDWINHMWTTHATLSSIIGGLVFILALIHSPNTPSTDDKAAVPGA
jgi:DMSO reductase anchor subunit